MGWLLGEECGYGSGFDDPICVLPCSSSMNGGWSAGDPQGKAPEGPRRDLPWKTHLFSFTKFYLFRRGKVNGLHYESEQVT